LYTQHAGGRPFGISMLVGGVDKKGSRLFWTDRSGAFFAYRAWAIGAGGDAANEILEAEYRDDLSLDDSIALGLKCMTKVLEGEAEPQKIRGALIDRESGKFRKPPGEEAEQYIKGVDAGRKAPARKRVTTRIPLGQKRVQM